MLSILLKDSSRKESKRREFYSCIYQKVPKLYSNDSNNEPIEKKQKLNETHSEQLFKNLINTTPNDITHLLYLYQQTFDIINENTTKENEIPTPIFFKDLQTQDPASYNYNPHAAFVDGCSIIFNHLELFHESIYKLCTELTSSQQDESCFHHVFANGYLTPPSSQAVKAHADDRDVFIVQLFGCKTWKIYKDVPIPHPYHHEQVGKNNLKVPESVFQNILLEKTLQPGDVLYIPRGFVHEASTAHFTSSFHATIAIPTHDWSYANVFSQASRDILNSDKDFRLAISQSNIEEQLKKMKVMMQEKVTSEYLLNILKQKRLVHHEKTKKLYEFLQEQFESKQNSTKHTSRDIFMGKEAIENISLESIIRAATKEEREAVIQQEQNNNNNNNNTNSGVTVREETMTDLFGILSHIKTQAKDKFNISQLKNLLKDQNEYLDDLTILCFVKVCVLFGALVLVI